MNREEYENALFDRAHQYMADGICLSELIEKEHLEELSIEYETILYAMEACHAIVPCYDSLILAYDHYDADSHNLIAEYAIYVQKDRDGKNLTNAINYNADYELEYVGEETFENMAAAIAYAYNLLRTLNSNDQAYADRQKLSAGPKYGVRLRCSEYLWCAPNGKTELYDTEREAEEAAQAYNDGQNPANCHNYYFAEKFD